MFCTETDIVGRMTQSGYDQIVDRNQDGDVDDDMGSVTDDAIQFAQSEIESALVGVFGLSYLRSLEGNTILRDIAVAISVERLSAIGSPDVGDRVYLDAKRARDKLSRLAQRAEYLPGVIYPRGSLSVPRYPRELAGRILRDCDDDG